MSMTLFNNRHLVNKIKVITLYKARLSRGNTDQS